MPSPTSIQYGTYLTHGALVMGLVPCANGINALLRPESALAMLQFPAPSGLEAQKLAHSLILIFGARDLALGLAMLGVWYTGHREALGWVVLSVLPIVIADGLASRYQIGRGEWNHWAFAPVVLGLGAGLLGWI